MIFNQVDDLVNTLKKMTDYHKADVCIDAVGAEADGDWLYTTTGVRLKVRGGAATALKGAIESCREAGIVSIVGVYRPPLNKGLTLHMDQFNVKRYLPRSIEHVQAGRVKPSDSITHRVPHEEDSETYHRFSRKN